MFWVISQKQHIIKTLEFTETNRYFYSFTYEKKKTYLAVHLTSGQIFFEFVGRLKICGFNTKIFSTCWSEEISSPSKLFHGAPFSYFSETSVSKRFYSNLISKSKSHLIFPLRLYFYVLFLGLIFRNYLLPPKLNHGFSGENTTFLKISYKYTHHTKYLPLEVYILSTSNFNRIDRFKHKIALKHNFQSNNFSQRNHDNEFTV